MTSQTGFDFFLQVLGKFGAGGAKKFNAVIFGGVMRGGDHYAAKGI